MIGRKTTKFPVYQTDNFQSCIETFSLGCCIKLILDSDFITGITSEMEAGFNYELLLGRNLIFYLLLFSGIARLFHTITTAINNKH